MPGPGAKVPEVAISSLDLVKKLDASDASTHNKATMIQLYFDAQLNEELELLVEYIQEIEVDLRDPRLFAPFGRGDFKGVVDAVSSACRAKFITMLREHKRDIE